MLASEGAGRVDRFGVVRDLVLSLREALDRLDQILLVDPWRQELLVQIAPIAAEASPTVFMSAM